MPRALTIFKFLRAPRKHGFVQRREGVPPAPRGEVRRRPVMLRVLAHWLGRRDACPSLALLVAFSFWTDVASAQNASEPLADLARERFKSGAETLNAFAPVARQTRHSVVKLDVDGSTVALATVID